MSTETCQYRIKLTKLNELKFISHLDWQNLILKSFRRAGVKLALSEGFAHNPKVSFSPALPVFIESECELVNFTVLGELKENFISDFEKNTSENVKISDLYKYPQSEKKAESLDTLVQWAKYEARLLSPEKKLYDFKDVLYNLEKCLSNDDLFIKKVNKKGIEKIINYSKSVRNFEWGDETVLFVLKTGQDDDILPLRADDFLKAVFGKENLFKIKRINFFDKDLKVL